MIQSCVCNGDRHSLLYANKWALKVNFFPWQIAITAALGFDSYLVMRHGAGPNIHTPDINSHSSGVVNDVNSVASQMENLSAKDGDSTRRLGCYFCSDVVAPIDVIF